MLIRIQTLLLALAPALLFGTAISGFAQTQVQKTPQPYATQYWTPGDYLHTTAAGRYPGQAQGSPSYGPDQSFDSMYQAVRQAQLQAQHNDAYAEYLEHQRRAAEALRRDLMEPQAHANPDAPDQSELLKNAKDPDFILRNFRTMYVDAHDAQFFDSAQMKAALGKNKEFQNLRIHIVDDPSVADVVLKVGYTFAWDYPFELRHQNTTIVLLAGKGEGPFSGPLGAADVARQFVKRAKPWREGKPATEAKRDGQNQFGTVEDKHGQKQDLRRLALDLSWRDGRLPPFACA